MLQINEEYLAAGLRKQMVQLQQLVEDMEKRRAEPKGITVKIRTVEAELRRLRGELISLTQE